MMENTLYEIKKCSLITKSPIHIGSVEQQLTPFEYIRSNNQIFFTSDEKLTHFLAKNNIIDAYVRSVSIEGHKFKLMNFFKEKGLKVTDKDLLELSGHRYAFVIGDPFKLQYIRPLIRDGMGEVYIPGTSLKGVFKAAVLYDLLSKLKLNDRDGFTQHIENRISTGISNKANKKFFFSWGLEKWFESFKLSGKSKSPNTDWFRMLHVTDAYPIEEIKTTILPISILKKEKVGWKLKTEKPGVNTLIWAECIPEGTAFEFQISWDKKLLETFKTQNDNTMLPENLDEAIGCIERWANVIKMFEEEFSMGHPLSKWYHQHKVNFRIGFGSGMISTTIALLLPETLRKQIRNYAGFNKGDDEAPKSRRVWINNGQTTPFGWAILEVLPFDATKGLFSRSSERMTNVSVPDEQVPTQTQPVIEKPVQKAVPQQITWQRASLTYSPGNKTLIATYQNKKAELHIGDDRSIVPEVFHKTLFEKRKGVQLNVVVEPLGNAFKIIRLLEK
jgi:CRISPR-associated protein Csm5